MRPLIFASGIAVGLVFSVVAVSAWTGPQNSPPNCVSGQPGCDPPINVGTTAQIKNGDIGVNNISAFGNMLLSGLGVGSGRYLNFDYTSGGTSGTGSSGYGIRDNAGTLEFKNSGGTWATLQSLISGYTGYWTAGTAGAIYYNGGNVGVGTASPAQKLHVSEAGNNTYAAEFDHTNVTASNGVYIKTRTANAADVALLVQSNNGATNALIVRNTGNVGIGTASPTQKLEVNGNLRVGANGGAGIIYLYGSTVYDTGNWLHLGASNTYADGNLYAPAFLYQSDARLKEAIRPLKDGLAELMKLTPVSFVWKVGTLQAGTADIGFIAQDVEKVIPGIVHTDEKTDLKSIDYPKLVPILVRAIQEQQADNERQQHEIDGLREQLRDLRDQQL